MTHPLGNMYCIAPLSQRLSFSIPMHFSLNPRLFCIIVAWLLCDNQDDGLKGMILRERLLAIPVGLRPPSIASNQ